MEEIAPQSIAVTIITYAPGWYDGPVKSISDTDKIRGDLVLETLRAIVSEGYVLVVVDGGSADAFVEQVRAISHIVFDRMPIQKRSPKKQRAYSLAAAIPDVTVIMTMEGEKVGLVASIPKIVAPILENKADIVIPKRENALFCESYPEFQYESETEANQAYNKLLREKGLLHADDEDLDVFFGGVVFRNTQEITSLFQQRITFREYESGFPTQFHDPEQYMDAVYFPPVMALQRHKKVISVTVPFRYPQIQKENEEQGNRAAFIQKRKDQAAGILDNLRLFLNI